MPNFHIEGRQKNLSDVQRNFLWEIEFVSPKIIQGEDVDGLPLRVKNLSTPSRNIEFIETWFYGLKQNIPSKTSFNNQITVLFEETEDQYVLKTFYKWMERIQSVDPFNALVTLGRKVVTKNMLIKQIKYNGEYSKNIIELKNVYPISINESSLDFAGNDSIKYDVTFNYDYWILIQNGIKKNLSGII